MTDPTPEAIEKLIAVAKAANDCHATWMLRSGYLWNPMVRLERALAALTDAGVNLEDR